MGSERVSYNDMVTATCLPLVIISFGFVCFEMGILVWSFVLEFTL